MNCDRNICYAQDYSGGCETCPCNGENKTELVEDKQTLLSCPFCGGEATIYGSKTGYGVMCKDKPFCAILPAGFSTKERAIEVWNTRRPMDRIVEQLEAVRKYNEVSYKEWMGATFGEMYKNRADSYERAIEIVKAGGKDE